MDKGQRLGHPCSSVVKTFNRYREGKIIEVRKQTNEVQDISRVSGARVKMEGSS